MQAKNKPHIVLASASPRRKELLAKAGYKLTVEISDIKESDFVTDQIEPWEFTEKLALAKAKNVAPRYPDKIIIGADTVVDYRGIIIGKPEDETDARKIVETLFSQPHKVITGLAIVRISDNIELVAHDITTVYPKQMSRDQIAEHINSGTWKDKAGAYAIQENGDEFIERLDGSLTNVIGLPMELLEYMLTKVAER